MARRRVQDEVKGEEKEGIRGSVITSTLGGQ